MSTTIESLELEVISSSADATKGLLALIETLEKLEKVAEGGIGLDAVTKEISGLSKAVDTLTNLGGGKLTPVIRKISGETDELTSSNNGASTSYVNFYAKLKTVYSSAKKVVDVIKSCVGETNDYIENVNLFNVSMGQYANNAGAYAKKVSDVMGLDPGEWMRNQGVFMTLATGFGITGDRAYTMSQQLTQLGYDLSSFFNISYEDAMEKLQSGLSGELEPLRRIGYDLSQAKLQAIALELGITKSISAMTQAEKAQLRYYAILTQVTTAQGDMARTLEDPANQLRIFNAQVTQAARAIGSIFIPALSTALPYLTAIAKVIAETATSIASMLGFEMPEIGDTIGDISDGANGMANGFEESTEQAKKLKSYLMGFDELNVINPSENSVEIDSSLGGFNFDLPTYDFINDELESRIDKIATKIKSTLEPLIPFFEGLWNVVSSASDVILDFEGTVLYDWLVDVGQWMKENPDTLKKLGEMIGKVAIGALGLKALAPLPKLSFNVSKVCLDAASVILTIASLSLLWDGISDLFDADTSPQNELFGAVKTAIGAALLGASLGLGSGKGLSFTLPLSLGLASASLSLVVTKMLTDKNEENDFLASVLAAIATALGGVTLTKITGASLRTEFPLILALSSLMFSFTNVAQVVSSDGIENALIPFVEQLLSTALAGMGWAVRFGGTLPQALCWMLPIVIALDISFWLDEQGVYENLKRKFDDLGDQIEHAITGAVDKNVGNGRTWVENTLDWVNAWGDGLWGTVKAIFTPGTTFPPLDVDTKNVGKQITAGVADGIIESTPVATGAVSNVADGINAAFCEDLQINSPSKLFAENGRFIVEGLAQGIDDSAPKVTNSFDSLFSNIGNKLNSFTESALSTARSFVARLEQILSSVEMGMGVSTSMSDVAKVSLKAYASGGFPSKGEVFVAREAGAEMVGNIGNRTAVANNDQIVESIRVGVYDAVSAAYSQQDTNGSEVHVYIDGDEVSTRIQRKSKGLGKPIYSGGVL